MSLFTILIAVCNTDFPAEPILFKESSAAIIAFAAEDHGSTDKGGDLTFWTSPEDQNDDTDGFERMRIGSDGNVGINTDQLNEILNLVWYKSLFWIISMRF